MLSFATEFPVDAGRTSSEFIEAVQFWILNSPHTAFNAKDLEPIPQGTSWTIQKNKQKIDALIVSQDDEESVAFRHTNVDGNIEWQTAVTFSRTSSDAWVAVRTSRESSHPATRLPPAKKPRIVQTLLEFLGGGKDGKLTVNNSASALTNNDIQLAASLISGEANCHLPVIYISCGFNGRPDADANSIAHDLAGMAHVILEPNRPFSRRLQIEVNSENVYGGAVGIYWPYGQGRRSVFSIKDFDDHQLLKKTIKEEVRIALTNRRPLVRSSWSTIEGTASQIAYSTLKASGSVELDKYIEAFDSDSKAKDDRIADAEKEISRLQAEIRKYESNATQSKGITLQIGLERDFYEGEIAQIILDAINESETRVLAGSRRHHILKAIIDNTPAISTLDDRREAIKELLRGYTSLDAKIKRGLEGIGFSISEEGKHHKLVFQDDDRYIFVLSKSGSDHRAGLNAASEIAKKLF